MLIEFECSNPKCKEVTEKIGKSGAEIECPECGSPAYKILPTSLNAHCYGSGIYKPSVRD